MYPKKELAQLIISACKEFSIDTVVISPGSRNAPLTIGFSNDVGFDSLSIVDERCAAFFALGIAQKKQKPVAIVCTSGSALLNYYPAVAEAYYSQIPLVVISADRPKHLIDVGDGQTIRQENVFANHILYSANLEEGTSEENKQELAKAFTLLNNVKGPIHINAPFDEPLYETLPELTTYSFDIPELDKKKLVDYSSLVEKWNQSIKKMILVGVHQPDKELEKLLDIVSTDPSVLVLTETTSNLNNKQFVYSIDNLIFNLTEDKFKELQPDVLLTFGGLIVSKKIKKFLRDYPPAEHWHVNELRAFDTYFSLTEHIEEDSLTFFKTFSELVKTSLVSEYRERWISYKQRVEQKHHQFLEKAPYSDLVVFKSILDQIPDETEVHFSNSSVIRYSQLFYKKPSINVFCNRGTSGIDGSTSTALGFAYASEKRTLLVTGDLSFFYDSNALWNNHIPNDFRIILVNNSGGGIFKIIPGPDSTEAFKYFTTPHNLTAEHLCAMYGFEYNTAKNESELQSRLSTFFEGENPKLLEVFTPSDSNDKTLKNYINSLR